MSILLAVSQILLALCIALIVSITAKLRRRIESLESKERNRQIRERAERSIRNG